jgi:hypothetical protein
LSQSVTGPEGHEFVFDLAVPDKWINDVVASEPVENKISKLMADVYQIPQRLACWEMI